MHLVRDPLPRPARGGAVVSPASAGPAARLRQRRSWRRRRGARGGRRAAGRAAAASPGRPRGPPLRAARARGPDRPARRRPPASSSTRRSGSGAGRVVTIPLADLPERDAAAGPVPRSSHVLPIGQLVAIAAIMRDAAARRAASSGSAARSFGFGRALGRPGPRGAAGLPGRHRVGAHRRRRDHGRDPRRLTPAHPRSRSAGPNGPRLRSPCPCRCDVPPRHACAHDTTSIAPRYPGLPAIVDGSEAIAHVETRIVGGRLRLPDHARRRRWRPSSRRAVADGRDEPVGHAAPVHRARVGALVGVGRGGRRAGRRPGDELHGRPGPRADEGGPVRHQRQAPAGRLPRRRPRADQPGPQHPRRPRRRDGRRGHRLGDPVRAQRPGGGRPDRHRPARRRGDGDAVHGRPGRLPDDAHARERPAARGRPAARASSATRASASATCSTRPRR